MWLVTALIVIILLLCIKTLMVDLILPQFSASGCRGSFSNTVLVDVAGINRNYGITSLASGINYRSYTLDSNNYDGDNDEVDSDGGGNFTNRPRPDPRYLEDVMDDQCWSDICMRESLSGKVVGKSCNSRCPTNLGPGYVRTFGDNIIQYNDDIADSQFKEIQHANSNKTIIVPSSDLYNNIAPANPSIR